MIRSLILVLIICVFVMNAVGPARNYAPEGITAKRVMYLNLFLAGCTFVILGFHLRGYE
jgi:hypothetical protein